MTPPVSICIPLFNAEEHIAETLESAFAQSFENIEVIVVDNASTDRSVEIVRSFDDERLTLHQNDENIGAERNFNRALGLARGDFVKLLCSDDVLFTDCISRQHAVLDRPESSGITLVSAAREVIDSRGTVVVRKRGGGGQAGRIIGARAVKRCIRHGRNFIGEPSSVLMRRDVALNVGGFRSHLPYVTDLDLWFRLLSHGDLFFIPDPLTQFRVRLDSVSAQLARVQAAQSRAFIRRMGGAHNASRLDVALGSANLTVQTHARRVMYTWLGRRATRQRT